MSPLSRVFKGRRPLKNTFMKIEKLYLYNFKNAHEETLTFAPGVNVIYGENASGKTNLL